MQGDCGYHHTEGPDQVHVHVRYEHGHAAGIPGYRQRFVAAVPGRKPVIVHHAVDTLYTQDLLQPSGVGAPGVNDVCAFGCGPFPYFFQVDDNSGGDHGQQVGDRFSRGSIEKVEFGKNTASGSPPISVTANFGKGTWTAETIDNRSASALDSAAPLKRYRIDFVFDGKDYKPTPASSATAKIFYEAWN